MITPTLGLGCYISSEWEKSRSTHQNKKVQAAETEKKNPIKDTKEDTD